MSLPRPEEVLTPDSWPPLYPPYCTEGPALVALLRKKTNAAAAPIRITPKPTPTPIPAAAPALTPSEEGCFALDEESTAVSVAVVVALAGAVADIDDDAVRYVSGPDTDPVDGRDCIGTRSDGAGPGYSSSEGFLQSISPESTFPQHAQSCLTSS